jgi:hypothetical protein
LGPQEEGPLGSAVLSMVTHIKPITQLLGLSTFSQLVSGLLAAGVTSPVTCRLCLYFQAILPPLAPAQSPGLGLVACGLAVGHVNSSGIPVGVRSPPTARLGEQAARGGRLSLRHLIALLAGHKSWKCLMRSLYPGLGGWTLLVPWVADTCCYQPMQRQSELAQAGKAALLTLLI